MIAFSYLFLSENKGKRNFHFHSQLCKIMKHFCRKLKSIFVGKEKGESFNWSLRKMSKEGIQFCLVKIKSLTIILIFWIQFYSLLFTWIKRNLLENRIQKCQATKSVTKIQWIQQHIFTFFLNLPQCKILIFFLSLYLNY